MRTMRGLFKMVLSAWTLAAGLGASPAWAGASVMITYFEPFGGARANNAESVGHELRSELLRAYPGLSIHLCRLPTEYRRGTEVARACLAGLHDRGQSPSLVLSLGEASCSIKLERLGRNRDQARLADNAGWIHRDNAIRAGGPATVALNLPWSQMRSTMTQAQAGSRRAPITITLSDDAGGFVCNHLAYELGADLLLGEEGAERVRSGFAYGFIHVPNHRCDARVRDPHRVAALLAMSLEPLLGR